MAALQLDDYIRNGNIKNSVNFPAMSMPVTTGYRVCVLHKNIPAMISKVAQSLSEHGINIEHMMNKSRGDNAYTVLDVNSEIDGDILASINAIDGVRRVRVIKF
jgi:D-3-phosphoglycerate dehydrogenase